MPEARSSELLVFLRPTFEDRQANQAYQEELKLLFAAASDKGVGITRFHPPVGVPLAYSFIDALGTFAVHHAPEAASILVAWLAGRNGRKVRIKIGDLEAEARTPEELEKILEKAHEIQQRNEPKKIYEP